MTMMRDAIIEVMGGDDNMVATWTFLLQGGHVIAGSLSADYGDYFTVKRNDPVDDLARIRYSSVVAFY